MHHPDRVWTVKWSADGKLLATICMDGAARIWDPATGHLLLEPLSHEKGKQVRRAGFSPDGLRFITSSFDGTMKIWDLTFVHPPAPAPEWLPELAESLGGKRIGPKDIVEPVPGEIFHNVTERISQAGGQDFYSRWARWMLEERRQRPVKPFQP
jgi:WD40 repeat protein